jgi:histidyl-tRNA synthetase
MGAGLHESVIDSLLRFVTPAHNSIYSRRNEGSDSSGDDNLWINASSLNLQNPALAGVPVYFDNDQLLRLWDTLFTTSKTGHEAVSELRQIVSVARAAGYGSQRIRIDPSVVRGLEYYTGPVYEAELTFEVKDEKGNPVRFGSVAGGGRYDDLVARFTGQPVPATGFSIGVSRLMAALKHLGKIHTRPARGPVLVTVFRDGSIADYQKLVAALRNADIRAELYLGSRNHNLGQQLKYADRRGSPCAVIQGGDEKASGKVLVRDLVAGSELAKLEQSAREDYLKKQTEAQFSVPEGDLVQAVKDVLARHGIK